MKNLLFAFAAFVSFSAIGQSSKIQASELPQKAREFLSSYYKYRPFDSIRKTEKIETPYEVRLAQGTAITFSENGEWTQVDGKGSALPKSLLPSPISDYLEQNFPKKRVVLVHRNQKGYEVGLKGNLALVFDSAGKPVTKS